MREDIKLSTWASAMGFTALRLDNQLGWQRSTYDHLGPVPHHGLIFTLNGVEIWQVRGGWRSALFAEGHYSGHSSIHSTLFECLLTVKLKDFLRETVLQKKFMPA